MTVRVLAHFSPGRTILFSIFLTIVAGTLALALPIARTAPIPLIDLFFTASSATCVTGLFTIPFDLFTGFGKCVILILIQIGGLGLITMSLFLISLFVDFGLATQLMAGQILEIESWKNVRKVILVITLITVCTELAGMFIISAVLAQELPLGTAIFEGFFHSISSFCNAGIACSTTFLPYMATSTIIIITTMILVLIGGLGFLTWHEIITCCIRKWRKQRYRFSLQGKMILYGSTALITCSTIVFWILERNHSLLGMSIGQTLLQSLFHAIALRSAGILLIPASSLQLATILLIIGLAFIGSSPASTGSGVKITTFTVLIMTIKAALMGKNAIEVRGRRIPIDQVLKAGAIVALSLFWIMLTTFCLLITEQVKNFLDIFLEAVAAFTNLGISTGITPQLSFIGKLFIIASMIVGRVGSVGFILALRLRPPEKREFSYPEERVMLG